MGGGGARNCGKYGAFKRGLCFFFMKFKWIISDRQESDLWECLLARRGVLPNQRQEFLYPDWDKNTHSPFLFTRMEEAVERFFTVLTRGEKIIIHGDYDADGVSGSALLYTTIEEIIEKMNSKSSLEVFLPDRQSDGYGVAKHTMQKFIKDKTNLVITVDCGIANADVFDLAHASGVSVIICDHHQLGERVPEHAFVIHPLVPGEVYPNKTLCGTGVAFKFDSALIEEARKRGFAFPTGHEKWLLDFVAIATVTDVMPLLGENRTLETYGLKVLNKTRRPGILKIIELSGSTLGSIDTETIGFRIGPRLNAAGRIGSARLAFDTLVAKTIDDAIVLAAQLESLNRERQRITAAAYVQARALALKKPQAFVQVVTSNDWAPGIVGLLSGKLATEFGLPAFAFASVNGQFVGSGRSAGDMHLLEAMKSCGDIFVKAGGHPAACGLTLATHQDIELFEELINKFARDFFKNEAPQPELILDGYLNFSEVTFELFDLFKLLSPFGQGNREPIFVSEAVINEARAVGERGDHLKLTLRTASGIRDLIGFGFGKLAEKLPVNASVKIAYNISVNEWNGNKTLQGKIVDIEL